MHPPLKQNLHRKPTISKCMQPFRTSEQLTATQARARFNALYTVSTLLLSTVLLLRLLLVRIKQQHLLLVSASACVWLSLVVSLHTIGLHILSNDATAPVQVQNAQRWSLRFAWLSPVYSLSALISLWCTLEHNCGGPKPFAASVFDGSFILVDSARDVFEAYSVLCFVRLVIELIELEGLNATIANKPAGRFMHPFRAGVAVGHRFQDFILGAAIDYMWVQVVAAILSALAVCCDGPDGVYGAGMLLNPRKLFPYVVLAKTAAQSWAILNFITLWRMVKDELPSKYRITAKFLTLKALIVVFWYEDVLLSLILNISPMPKFIRRCTDGASLEQEALFDWLLTVQMVGMSIAVHYCFSWDDFNEAQQEALMLSSRSIRRAVRNVFYTEDVQMEMNERAGEWVRWAGQSYRRTMTRLRSNKSSTAAETNSDNGGNDDEEKARAANSDQRSTNPHHAHISTPENRLGERRDELQSPMLQKSDDT